MGDLRNLPSSALLQSRSNSTYQRRESYEKPYFPRDSDNSNLRTLEGRKPEMEKDTFFERKVEIVPAKDIRQPSIELVDYERQGTFGRYSHAST